MSFILDALKKSEAERRQGEVPGLQNEPVSAPFRRRSLWPLLLTTALLLNGAVFGWWLLGKEEPPSRTAAVAVPRETARPADADGTATAERTVAPPTEAISAHLPEAPKNVPPAAPASPSSVEAAVDTVVMPALPLAAAGPSDQGGGAQPTQLPAPASAPAKAVSARPPAAAYPLLAELPANVRAGLPGLNLQLHFYTPAPERRMVRLNGLNLREGETGAGGLQVVEIAPDGIRLDCGGVRFFLPTGRP